GVSTQIHKKANHSGSSSRFAKIVGGIRASGQPIGKSQVKGGHGDGFRAVSGCQLPHHLPEEGKILLRADRLLYLSDPRLLLLLRHFLQAGDLPQLQPLMDLLLNRTELLHLPRSDKSEGNSRLTRPSGTTDAMDIAFGVLGNIIV